MMLNCPRKHINPSVESGSAQRIMLWEMKDILETWGKGYLGKVVKQERAAHQWPDVPNRFSITHPMMIRTIAMIPMVLTF